MEIVRNADGTLVVPVEPARRHDIEVEWSASHERLTWSVANRADDPVPVEAVALVYRLESVVEPLL